MYCDECDQKTETEIVSKRKCKHPSPIQMTVQNCQKRKVRVFNMCLKCAFSFFLAIFPTLAVE